MDKNIIQIYNNQNIKLYDKNLVDIFFKACLDI